MKFLLTRLPILLFLALPLSLRGAEEGPRKAGRVPEKIWQDPAFASLPKTQRRAWEEWMTRSVAMREAEARQLADEAGRTWRHKVLTPKKPKEHTVPPDKKPDAWYGTAEARKMAGSLLTWQTPSGGWTKNMDMTRRPRKLAQRWAPGEKWDYVATIDNRATTSQIEFLAKTAAASGPGPQGDRYRQAAEHGIYYLLAAQMPSGGWPQVFPLQGRYHDHITFNDDAMVRVLTLLRHVERGEAPWQFVSDSCRAAARHAVRRGTGCILRCQIVVKGQRSAWCAQHHAITLAPVPARAYEPASISGGESVNILRFLMSLDPDTPGVRQAVESGTAWFRKARLKPGQAGVEASRTQPEWARFYELGTSRPIFSDSDGKIRYSYKEVKNKKDTYAWHTSSPEKLLQTDYPKWKAKQSKED
ncbi:MAG: pectate lyase [Verrucomicrobiota bacterium]